MVKRYLILVLLILSMLALSSCGLREAIKERTGQENQSDKDTNADGAASEGEDQNTDGNDTTPKGDGSFHEPNLDEINLYDTGDDELDMDEDEKRALEEIEQAEAAIKGTYGDFQSALSTFVGDYMNLKSPYYDVIDKDPKNSDYMMDLLGFYMVDLIPAEAVQYDAFIGTGDRVTGTLMLSGYEAYKEKNENNITFGYTYTFDSDSGANLKGDVLTSTGQFDTVTAYMTIESTVMSQGELVSRTVTEMKRLADGSFALISIQYDSRTGSGGASATIAIISDKSMKVVLADSTQKLDFTFTSLKDLDETAIESLVEPFTQSFSLNVIDNKVTYTK